MVMFSLSEALSDIEKGDGIIHWYEYRETYSATWTNPKQWQMGHTSDLMMIVGSITGILTSIIREMGKLYKLPHILHERSRKLT